MIREIQFAEWCNRNYSWNYSHKHWYKDGATYTTEYLYGLFNSEYPAEEVSYNAESLPIYNPQTASSCLMKISGGEECKELCEGCFQMYKLERNKKIK